VVDFLFAIIEHFLLALTVETLKADIGRKFFKGGWVTLSANFRWKGTSPTDSFWYQKTRVISCSCSVKISAVYYSVLSQSTRMSDSRTDGETDRITIPKTALA